MNNNSTFRDATDEDAIRAIHREMLAAWNAGDATAFIAPLTFDADFVAFDGSHLQGRDEISSFHRRIFAKAVKGSRLAGDVKFVRFVSSVEAVMHSVISYTADGNSDVLPSRASTQLTVVSKRNGKWRAEALMHSRRVSNENQLFLDDVDLLPLKAHQEELKNHIASLKRRDDNRAIEVMTYEERGALAPSLDEIAAVWDGMSRAWEVGSGKDFAAAFTRDACFIAFDGTILRGPDAIARFHQQAFDAHLKGTRLVAQVEETKTLGNVVLAFASGHIERDGAKTGELIGESVQTAVVVRTKDSVLIEAFQNTRSRQIVGEASADAWKIFDRAWSELGQPPSSRSGSDRSGEARAFDPLAPEGKQRAAPYRGSDDGW